MLNSPKGCELLPEPGALANKWLQPLGDPARLLQCMSSLTGALPFPCPADEPEPRTRVDHRNTDEAALVRRVQARDEMAFREIVERYQAKVFSIIYGILRNHNDAEDIAQQVFAKIYFSIKNLRFPQLAAHLDLQDHGE